MRLNPPPGGASLFDFQPELFGRFNRLYGTLWSLGSVDQATKDKITEAIAELRTAMQGEDNDAVKAKTDALNQAVYALSAQLYNQGGQAGGPTGGDSSGGDSSDGGGDDNVVDADYEEVK